MSDKNLTFLLIHPEISRTKYNFVGIIENDEEAISSNQGYGMVGYTHQLMEHLIEKTNDTEIVKSQLDNKEINVFICKSLFHCSTIDLRCHVILYHTAK